LRTVPLRLEPGSDLRGELERAASALPESAAFVLCGIGSLGEASLRFAGAEVATLVAGPLELLSLSGTVTPEGAHLHASVSNASGQVLGGHVLTGCRVRTTAEILLGRLPEWRLWREHDPASGYRELRVAGRERDVDPSP
jgi:predicted DNA-binding protein with PD1-like motif